MRCRSRVYGGSYLPATRIPQKHVENSLLEASLRCRCFDEFFSHPRWHCRILSHSSKLVAGDGSFNQRSFVDAERQFHITATDPQHIRCTLSGRHLQLAAPPLEAVYSASKSIRSGPDVLQNHGGTAANSDRECITPCRFFEIAELANLGVPWVQEKRSVNPDRAIERSHPLAKCRTRLCCLRKTLREPI